MTLVFRQRLKPTNPTAQKALTTPTHYKLTPRPATRVRPKALSSSGASKSQLFDGLDDDEPSLTNGAFVPRLPSCCHSNCVGTVWRVCYVLTCRVFHRKSIKKLVLKNLNSSQYNSPINKETDDLASPAEYPQNGHRFDARTHTRRSLPSDWLHNHHQHSHFQDTLRHW